MGLNRNTQLWTVSKRAPAKWNYITGASMKSNEIIHKFMSYQNTYIFSHWNPSECFLVELIKADVQAKMQRQVDLWGSLASQSSLFVEFQVSGGRAITRNKESA